MSDLAVFRISIQGDLDDSWSDYYGTREIAMQRLETEVAAAKLATG